MSLHKYVQTLCFSDSVVLMIISNSEGNSWFYVKVLCIPGTEATVCSLPRCSFLRFICLLCILSLVVWLKSGFYVFRQFHYSQYAIYYRSDMCKNWFRRNQFSFLIFCFDHHVHPLCICPIQILVFY